MPTVIIKKFRHLKNAGLLKNIQVGNWPLELVKFNLFYGFNGSGKSTVSRLLDSLAKQKISKHLSDDSDFSFEFADGTHASPHSVASERARLMVVFNEDFIENCLAWREATATPIVYLGEDQTKIAMEIEKFDQELIDMRSNQTLIHTERGGAEKTKSTFCTDNARLISENARLGRSYNASNIRNDLEDDTLCSNDKLTDLEKSNIKAIISKDDPPSAIDEIQFVNILSETKLNVQKTLALTIEQLSLEELDRRPDAVDWVGNGLHLHENENTCLFCGNDFLESRKELLKTILSGSFSDLKDKISSSLTANDQFEQSFITLTEKCQALSEPSPLFKPQFDQCRKAIFKFCKDAQKQAKEWRMRLESKSSYADRSVIADDKVSPDFTTILYNEVEKLNSLISQHNKSVENFQAGKAEAKHRLKRHHLFDIKSAYQQLCALENEAINKSTEVDESIKKLQNRIIALRTSMSAHGLAAERLNVLIHSYLGHSKISLKTDDVGYRICRGEKPSTKPLSEGERTAVAFCYFIASLTAEGKKVEDLIVVVDDPVSSLDSKSIFHVVSLVKRELHKAAQLLILTHNLDFMSEMKKWKIKKREKGEAQFFFIDTQHIADVQESEIVEMPKLIRDYESEYHYLFSMVKKLRDSPKCHEGYAYLMPNAIRKVLEIFLAFKVPGSSGVENKLDHIIQKNPSLDADRIKSMYRLAALESHAENIGETTTFSAYTLNQISDSAGCLLDVIEKLDSDHYKAMVRLCR